MREISAPLRDGPLTTSLKRVGAHIEGFAVGPGAAILRPFRVFELSSRNRIPDGENDNCGLSVSEKPPAQTRHPILKELSKSIRVPAEASQATAASESRATLAHLWNTPFIPFGVYYTTP